MDCSQDHIIPASCSGAACQGKAAASPDMGRSNHPRCQPVSPLQNKACQLCPTCVARTQDAYINFLPGQSMMEYIRLCAHQRAQNFLQECTMEFDCSVKDKSQSILVSMTLVNHCFCMHASHSFAVLVAARS